MAVKQKIDSTIAHRQAGMIAAFMWQDEANEGNLDAKEVGVDYTFIVGTLPDEVNGSPVYLVHVQGTATSTFGYSYPIEKTLKVYIPDREDDEDREPVAVEATEEEENACEQHGRALACKEYGELMHIVDTGAYTESSIDGSYWYPDEDGQNISHRIGELDWMGLSVGEHFAKQEDGTYKLEPATQEEIDAFEKAKAEADEEE
ncbi:hypothetical protein [Ktedonobacter racemifer]|uniref:Uncharacterized protein n=1 Tax=Ktedonobacter racemifer DSM 44963 TaxID=485913 RepID=D6U1Q7_KTERA|nr:hypothetical protein [Ktedonobacter racemifer]EFH82701.1 hypothetical protein Krac_3539 [Ktedonobacter racemifer DSM 44963]